MTYVQPTRIHAGFEIQGMTGALGAEIHGIDLGAPLSEGQVTSIRRALADHAVLVFRNQTIAPEGLARLGRLFGKLEEEHFIPKLDGHDGVHQLTGAVGGRLSTQNLHWHADHTYREFPSMGVLLYAVDVPQVGGDTVFANMYLAYETLSDTMRRVVDGLVVVHDVLQYGLKSGHFSLGKVEMIERLRMMRQRFPQVEHPLVCTHPDTGRRFLFINPAWAAGIKGMSDQESRPLLDFLNAHATQPKFQCRLRWQNGTLALWDNRCLQHSGIADYTEGRLMHRVAIAGTWRPC
jgi:taurine dioxygenase